jgi:hypothetical protein
MGKPETIPATVVPEEVYNSLVSKSQSKALSKWRNYLATLADDSYYNQKLTMSREVGIELVAYRLFCETLAAEMPEHDVIRKAEMSHRYFKSLKLAGAYAFLDKKNSISISNLRQAIKVAEDSGKSFQTLIRRERNFVRLAKYIAESESQLTHADLVADLPYYPSSSTPRKEIMDLAMAWGIGNHVVIKRSVISGVDFFSGSTLKETDLQKLSFSFSDHFASGYSPEYQAFDDLPKLLGAPGLHWCNHHFDKEHRLEDNVIEGFNMLVVDVDNSISLDAVHELLKEYTFITATTKRHTDQENRFRLILPANYNLALDKADYRTFMDNFLLWLPFDSDKAANQRSKKWMTNGDTVIKVHRGTALIDVLPFIPKTKKNAEYVNSVADLGNLDHLERWFLNNMDVGNRNNNLLNFAMMLRDAGCAYDELTSKVKNLNERSVSPLSKDEVEMTVLKSVAQKYV